MRLYSRTGQLITSGQRGEQGVKGDRGATGETGSGSERIYSAVTLLSTAYEPVPVSLPLPYDSVGSYEIGILRAWMDDDNSVPVSGIAVTDKVVGGFSLSAPSDGVRVYWRTEILT